MLEGSVGMAIADGRDQEAEVRRKLSRKPGEVGAIHFVQACGTCVSCIKARSLVDTHGSRFRNLDPRTEAWRLLTIQHEKHLRLCRADRFDCYLKAVVKHLVEGITEHGRK